MLNFFKIGTCLSCVVMDVLLIIEIFSEKGVNWRIIAVIGILIALGSIVTPLLKKIYPESV